MAAENETEIDDCPQFDPVCRNGLLAFVLLRFTFDGGFLLKLGVTGELEAEVCANAKEESVVFADVAEHEGDLEHVHFDIGFVVAVFRRFFVQVAAVAEVQCRHEPKGLESERDPDENSEIAEIARVPGVGFFAE